MHMLTDFGDSAVLLPLSALMLAWLIITRRTGAAIGWLIALGLCIGGMAVLKMVFFACAPTAGLESPSGHTAFGVLVYGGFAVMLMKDWRGAAVRVAVASLGIALALSIAISRVILRAHSPAEVILGLIVGALALGIFARASARDAVKARRKALAALLAATALILVAFHGLHLPIEQLLHSLSTRLGVRAVCTRPVVPSFREMK